MNVVITTTWNSQDVISLFLSHYRKLGFDRIFVMDFGSADGTLDILNSQEYRDFVELVPFPGLVGIDSSKLMLQIAKECLPAGSWCLFCDPDELLVTPSGERLWRLTPPNGDAITIPRFNMTGVQSAVLEDQKGATATGSLNLKIVVRSAREPKEDMWKEKLDPPWIYTKIPGKVFVNVSNTESIGSGDHSVVLRQGRSGAPPEDTSLLHYPIRSYVEFAQKVDMYRVHFDCNPQLSEGCGWQARRWVRIAREGRLWDEYKQQFPSRSLSGRLIRNGDLAIDTSITARHLRTGLPPDK